MVTSVTAVGLVWKWMFNYDYGLINYALSLFGVSPVNWLNDPHYNLAAAASLRHLEHAAVHDHSAAVRLPEHQPAVLHGRAHRRCILRAHFRRVTVPLLAPTLGLTMIVNIISASKVFSELFPLFNGNPGSAYSLYPVRVLPVQTCSTQQWELGPAAASAVVLFAIVLDAARCCSCSCSASGRITEVTADGRC